MTESHVEVLAWVEIKYIERLEQENKELREALDRWPTEEEYVDWHWSSIKPNGPRANDIIEFFKRYKALSKVAASEEK